MSQVLEPIPALLWDGPRSAPATLVLAHGAGAPMDTPFMRGVALGLASRGLSVVRFEFTYMEAQRRTGRRRGPDRMPALEACFRAAVRQVRAKRLFVGGKSMGSRVAAQIAGEVGAAGFVALGYPFHPPRAPDTLRLAPLLAPPVPGLIVQGTRDPFGTPPEVTRYALPPAVTVHWVDDGDHDLAPRVKSGRTHAECLAEAVLRIEAFMRATPSAPKKKRARA
ncbi:MAG: alpha/beta family hydrolase [Polyangiales bacterium]